MRCFRYFKDTILKAIHNGREVKEILEEDGTVSYDGYQVVRNYNEDPIKSNLPYYYYREGNTGAIYLYSRERI